MEKNPGTRLGGNIVLPPDDTPTLSDLGITKMQSSRWQLESTVPEKQFERYVAETKAANESVAEASWHPGCIGGWFGKA